MNKESNNTYFEYTRHSACRDEIKESIMTGLLGALLGVGCYLIFRNEMFLLMSLLFIIVGCFCNVHNLPIFNQNHPISYVDKDILKLYAWHKNGSYIPHTFELNQIDYIDVEVGYKQGYMSLSINEQYFVVIMKNGYSFRWDSYKMLGAQEMVLIRIIKAIEHYSNRKDIIHYKEWRRL